MGNSDEPEFEVSDLRSRPSPLLSASADSSPATSSTQRQSSFPGALLNRRWRLALAAASVLLALVVVLSVWLPLRNRSNAFTGYPSPTPRPTATLVIGSTPLPLSGQLAPAPANCPSATPLDHAAVPALPGFIGSTVDLSGGAPVWVPELFLPQSVAVLSQPTPQTSSGPTWPSLFIIWEIGPTDHPPVTVKVYDVHSGEVAWWAQGGSSPQMPLLIMNPSVDEPAATGYVAYQTLLFITHAGCYEMEVSWPGGGWSYIFAAGGSLPG